MDVVSTAHGPIETVHTLWDAGRPAGRLHSSAGATLDDQVHVEPSVFDSECLAHSCGRITAASVTPGREAEAAADVIRQAEGGNLEHVAVRLNAGAVRFVQALERRGFFLVDTQVTFECALPAASGAAADHVHVRPADPADEPAILAFGGEAFTHSRFRMDERIEDRAASTLQRQWLHNDLAGRADAVFVAVRDSVVAGFVACLTGPARAGHPADQAAIDLIAVHPVARGEGVGRALVHHVQAHYRDTASRVLVETQTHNRAAIRLYASCGFQWLDSSVTLHWWRP